MEDRNPNILPPFGIEKRHPHIPSSNSSQPHYDQNQNYQYRYQQQCQHHSQPPQYQQQHFSAPQVLQSQIVRGSNSTAAIDSYNNVVAISSSSRTMEYFQPQMQESYHSTAIDSYNNTVATSTFSPSAVTQNHSYTPSHALSENFQKDDTTEFWNIVGKSIRWKKSKESYIGPFFVFVAHENRKRSKGWCRDLAGISISGSDDSQTFKYYFDLLSKCAPSFTTRVTHYFYYAFDMDQFSLNRVIAFDRDQISLNHVIMPQLSILKRKRTSSSQPTTATTSSANGLGRFSASKRNKINISLKTARTLIQKNPVYNETSKLCEDLSQKRKILVSLKKRKKYIECSGQCDKEEYLNDCMENVIWNQNLRDLAPPTVEVYRNAKSHDSYQNKACM